MLNNNNLERGLTEKTDDLRSIQIWRNNVTQDNVTKIYLVKSSLLIKFTEDKRYRENFSCKSFHNQSNEILFATLFELPSKDSIDSIFDYFKQKLSVKKDSSRPLKNVPFIYWIILAICLMFSVTVILFATVCIIRSNRDYKKRKRASGRGMAGGSEYYYDSIAKRSAIYMRSKYDDRTLLKQPLKPIVIRDHQDYSSIYSDVHNEVGSSSNPHNSSLSTTLTSTTPNDLLRKLSGSGMSKPRQNINDLSFDRDPIDRSFVHRARADQRSTRSSSSDDSSNKLFEENFEEYQDPKFDDLSKPPSGSNIYRNVNVKPSVSRNSGYRNIQS